MPANQDIQRLETPASIFRGTTTLFFIQIFSTLSYSVLYSTLILYITEGLHVPVRTATGITATFIAFNYALHLLGGYFGGRLLSYRLLFSIGMFMQMLGCILLSVPTSNMMYLGLAAFLAGSGLNVTCINCMVTQLFRPDDKRRETAFLWNYSGMNIGFFIGFAIGGYFQLKANYHELFLLSSLGNLVALLLVVANWRILKDLNTALVVLNNRQRIQRGMLGIAGILALFIALFIMLQYQALSDHLVLFVGIFMGGVIATIAIRQPTKEASQKVWAYLILAIMSVIFWTLYQMSPTGLNLFIERNVNREVWGMTIPPEWVQNINTVVIVIGGPILAWVFQTMRRKGMNINIPLQFAVALLLIGTGYILLPLGIHYANPQGYTAFFWVVLNYILQSLGELFISPIGYAMVGQLAPEKLQGIMMGTWMMITGVAATLSGVFSQMGVGENSIANPLATNGSFSHAFTILGTMSITGSIVLFCLVPFLIKLVRESKAPA
jgi:POT family proton-dependent oligopeptide transporter